MVGKLGVTELLIILTIVIVLFGAGRIGRIGGELGTAVKNFREGIKRTSEEDEPEPEEAK